MVLVAGTPPQATVMSAGAVIVGSAAGLTVIILDTLAIVLPHISVAVHVSVTVPPQAFGVAVKVDQIRAESKKLILKIFSITLQCPRHYIIF